MDKKELLAALDRERENFLDLLEGISDEMYEQPGVAGEWSIKDLIAHIGLWEGELVRLLWQAKAGHEMTSIHFRNIPVDEINAQWQRQMKSRPLDKVLEDFHSVRNQTIRRVDAFSDRDLTDPHRYPWLDGKALWEWIAGDSFWHEAEHADQIRAWLANQSS